WRALGRLSGVRSRCRAPRTPTAVAAAGRPGAAGIRLTAPPAEAEGGPRARAADRVRGALGRPVRDRSGCGRRRPGAVEGSAAGGHHRRVFRQMGRHLADLEASGAGLEELLWASARLRSRVKGLSRSEPLPIGLWWDSAADARAGRVTRVPA